MKKEQKETLSLIKKEENWKKEVIKRIEEYLNSFLVEELERIMWGKDTIELTIEGNYYHFERIERREKRDVWIGVVIFIVFFLGVWVGASIMGLK